MEMWAGSPMCFLMPVRVISNCSANSLTFDNPWTRSELDYYALS